MEEARVESLPSCPLQPHTPPFQYTSCYYVGPMKVKIGQNKIMKHYGVIFTFLNSRAVHCELATDVSTMEFLQVLSTFFSYRGYLKMVMSDNGTQSNGWCRTRVACHERWLGKRQAERILCRTRHEVPGSLQRRWRHTKMVALSPSNQQNWR